MIEKARQDLEANITSDHKTKINQSGRSKRSLHESQGEPRGERDVIRLRNPTEEKRAFRRMLTSADRLVLIWLLYVLYLVVGLSINPFLILAIHCNRLDDGVLRIPIKVERIEKGVVGLRY